MIASAQQALDKQLKSKGAGVRSAEEIFEKDRKVIDGYINTHSQESMQEQAVIYEYKDFYYRGKFENPFDKDSRRLIYIDQDYFDKQLPSYVPQFFTMTWRWNDNAPGLFFKKQLEENFPIEKLQAMLPGSRQQSAIAREINGILSGFKGSPNEQNTWTSVKNKINTYLYSVWKEGNLMGTSTDKAFYIKVGQTTMTQSDITNGKLVVEVGLALSRPAEFVINRYEQKL